MDKRQAYIALTTLEDANGTKRWLPGSEIRMTDKQAVPLLVKGLVEPGEGTTAPALPAPSATVVEPGQSADLELEETIDEDNG